MEYKIKIDADTDIDAALKQWKDIKWKIQKHKEQKKTSLDLSKITLRRPNHLPSKYVIVPRKLADGTYTKDRTLRSGISGHKLVKARFEVYMQYLVNNAFRYPSKTYRQIKIMTNEQFKDEFKTSDSELAKMSILQNQFECYLETAGLWKNNIAEMLAEDLRDRKGNRDKLLQIAINLWDKIDDSKKAVVNDKTKEVVDMMKKIIDSQKAPLVLETKKVEQPIEEFEVVEKKEEPESLTIEQLKNKVSAGGAND